MSNPLAPPILTVIADTLQQSLDDALPKHNLQHLASIAALRNCLPTRYPALVILDDVAACQQLADDDTPSLLLLVPPDDVSAALNAGAADCLTLPLHAALLQHRVRQLLDDERNIIHAMHDPVMILNREGRCLRIPNVEAGDFTSDDPQSFVGRTLDEFIALPYSQQMFDAIDIVLETGNPQRVEYALRMDDNHNWFHAVLARLDAERVVMVKRNITHRHEFEAALRESEQRYRHLFESANDAILLVDIHTGRIVKANPQAVTMLGYPDADTLEQKHISAIEQPPNTQETKPFGKIENATHFITEARYQCQDGSTLDVETSSRIITYQERPTILCFARDISQRKRALRAEQDQRRLAEALRDTAAAFNSTLALDEVLDTILHNVGRVVPTDTANIMLVDDGVARIVRQRGYAEMGIATEAVDTLRHEVTAVENLQMLMTAQQPTFIADVTDAAVNWVPVEGFGWIRSYAGAPIILKGETIGFINLDSATRGHFSQEKAERLQAFADQAAIAIENAQLYEQAQQHAQELEERVQERTAQLTATNEALREQIQQRQEAEKSLDEERELLHTIIDNIPDPIYVKDREGRVLLANQAALSMVKLDSFKEAIGKTYQELFPADHDAQNAHAAELQVVRDETPHINLEYDYQDLEGNDYSILVSRIPLRDADGHVIGMIGINRDVTALKDAERQLQEERNLLRAIIDTIPDEIYVKDRDGRYVLVNQAMVANTDATTANDLIGAYPVEFDPAVSSTRFGYREEQVLLGAPIINQRETIQRSDGRDHQYLMTQMPLRDADESITGVISISRDVTDLHRAEQKLDHVLTSARCLLWTATVKELADGEYEWDLQVANEAAAQSFLPLALDDRSYTEAWQESIVPQDRERRKHIFRTHAAFKRYDYSMELRCTTVGDIQHWLIEEVQIRPKGDGLWELVGICTDITERKLAEYALTEMNEALERRVRARTQELTAANTNLRQEVQERKRAEEAERHQRRLAEALRDSVAMLNHRLERDAVFDYLLEAIVPVVPYDGGNIMLREDDTMCIVRARGYGENVTGDTFQLSQTPDFANVITTNEANIVYDTAAHDGWVGGESYSWVRSNITVPIRLSGEIIGFMNLDSCEPEAFTQQHARWLTAFADQAAIAIRNARLLDEIREYATTLEEKVDERTAQLDYERAQLKAILDAMRDGVIFYDLDGTPQYINQALTEITGYASDEWLQGSAADEMNTDDLINTRSRERKIAKVLAKQRYWEGERELRHKNGNLFDAAEVRTEVRNDEGERIGLVTVLRDISQAKQLEQQKARFIATASHELRTPITNIKTRLYLLQRNPKDLDRHIQIIESVVNLMQNLVENLFDIARFERGVIPLERETLSLQSFITQIIDYQKPDAQRLTIDLSTDFPDETVLLYADPFRLTQVLSNLISNALHHTHQHGSVTVKLDENDDEVIISVVDTGSGIPPEHLPQLFQPFFRGDDSSQGAGLGLSIAHEIVTLHGGHIDVESEVGVGTVFMVHLPVQPSKLDYAPEPEDEEFA